MDDDPRRDRRLRCRLGGPRPRRRPRPRDRRLRLRRHRSGAGRRRAPSGQDAIRAAWAPIFADTASRFEPEETFAAGDRVVQRWRYSWTGGHIRGVDVMRVRDGLVAEKLSYVKG